MSSEYHFYEPGQGHRLKHDPFNALIAPRPIGWIASQDKNGLLNLAPYSFFNAFNYVPPIIGFASVGYKDSVKNIQQTGEFCWHFVNKALAQKMNHTSASVPAEIDEFEMAELQTSANKVIKVPRVADAPVAMECRLTQIIQLQTRSGENIDTWMVFGEVVGVHINKRLIKDGVFDTGLANPVLRGGGPGDYFEITNESKFQLFRPKL